MQGDGDFIGGVQNTGGASTTLAGTVGKAKGREAFQIGIEEGQLPESGKIEGAGCCGATLWVRQGVSNRQTHIGLAKLGQDGAIDKFHHGVDGGLGMDDDLDFFVGYLKEVVGFDDLEPLVDEGGGIDRDLGPHVPGGMLEGAMVVGVFDFPIGRMEERTAAARQDHAANGGAGSRLQALKNGVVFTIDREEEDSFFRGGPGYQVSPADEDFLVGEGEMAPGMDGGKGGFEPHPADGGNHDQIGRSVGGDVHEALGSMEKGPFPVPWKEFLELPNLGSITHMKKFRAKFGDLAGEEGKVVPPCGKGHQLDFATILAKNLKGLDTDGTGGTKEGEAFEHHEGGAMASGRKWATASKVMVGVSAVGSNGRRGRDRHHGVECSCLHDSIDA